MARMRSSLICATRACAELVRQLHARMAQRARAAADCCFVIIILTIVLVLGARDWGLEGQVRDRRRAEGGKADSSVQAAAQTKVRQKGGE